MTSANEHDGRPGTAHYLGRDTYPLGVLNLPEVMGKLVDIDLLVRYLVTNRILLIASDYLGHISVERRREEDGLGTLADAI